VFWFHKCWINAGRNFDSFTLPLAKLFLTPEGSICWCHSGCKLSPKWTGPKSWNVHVLDCVSLLRVLLQIICKPKKQIWFVKTLLPFSKRSLLSLSERNEGEKRGTIPRSPNYYVCSEKSQQCHKYFLQHSTFTSERLQVRTWECQTCFLPRAPSNLVTPLVFVSSISKIFLLTKKLRITKCFRLIKTWKPFYWVIIVLTS